MSSFIPHSKAPKPTDNHTDNGMINNSDDFYPAIILSDFRQVMRVDDSVTDSRAVQQIKTAVYMITADIVQWRESARLNKRTLTIDQAELYKMAVYNKAKALIIENYRDIDTTKSGHNRADGMETRIDTYLARSRECQRLLTDKPRTTITLI
ncbi:MAG: head completion/stabilization protein [Gammaproteobacteria bacterium]|nr:head completion/stabilization protein [Gammaproteobacteria bacterium]